MILYRTIVLIFVLVNLGVANELMVLEPTVPGIPSRTILLPGKQDKWNYVIQYNLEEPYYYIPRSVGDTICVWFQSPVKCTLIAITRIWYFGPYWELKGSSYEAFASEVTTGITLDSFNVYEMPGPSPIGAFLEGPTPMIAPYDDYVWDTLWVTSKPDVGTKPFLGGYIVGVYNQATLSDDGSVPTYHSLQYRTEPPDDAQPGWYTHYVNFMIRALVKVWENTPPDIIYFDRLSDVYTPMSREVTAHIRDQVGVPLDSIGVEAATLFYNVNGGNFNPLDMELISGDSTNGVWSATIPATHLGDIICYYVTATDYQGASDTSETYCYTIVARPPSEQMFQRVANVWSWLSNYGTYRLYEWPGGTGVSYLFSGDLWIGTIIDNDTLVISTHDGFCEWYPSWGSSWVTGTGTSQWDIVCEYDDWYRSAKPLGVKVAQKALAWSLENYNNFIPYEYKITYVADSSFHHSDTLRDVFISWVFAGARHIEDLPSYDGWVNSEWATAYRPYSHSTGPYPYDEITLYADGTIDSIPDGILDQFTVFGDEPSENTLYGDTLYLWRNISYIYDGDDPNSLENDEGKFGIAPGYIGGTVLYAPPSPNDSVWIDEYGDTCRMIRPMSHQWFNLSEIARNDATKYLLMVGKHSLSQGHRFMPHPFDWGIDKFYFWFMHTYGPYDIADGDTLEFVFVGVMGFGLNGGYPWDQGIEQGIFEEGRWYAGLRHNADQALKLYYMGSEHSDPLHPSSPSKDIHWRYKNAPPEIIYVDKLIDSYITRNREVKAHITDLIGDPWNLMGVKAALLFYSVNSENFNSVDMVLISGDSTDGVWSAAIPGVNPGDTVRYYVVAIDHQNASNASQTYRYIVRRGTMGNILFYNDDYYGIIYDPIDVVYGDYVDYWNGEWGIPDSSVINFYDGKRGQNIIIWNSEDGGAFVEDTALIAHFLDNGGKLLISGQNFLYGITGTFGYWMAHPGGFIREYLHAIIGYDDAYNDSTVNFVGVSGDTISGCFTEGITVYPYCQNGPGYCRAGRIDWPAPGTTPIFRYSPQGHISGYRYEDPDKHYKIVFLYWPFNYITKLDNPRVADTLAQNTLIAKILNWFGATPSVAIKEGASTDFFLGQSNPNPTTHSITITYSIPKNEHVVLKIYNITGSLVKTLVNKRVNAGTYTTEWDTKNELGSKCASGIYFYQLKVGSLISTKKMIIVR
ncbi:MAG TPA: T9SS type A sorting domain-containing protein [bacterium (Candidatus Stahlbacteria)]|nr:T9SS type A sorting domain-containing protein [Candidatus Stahlbacteria bacterium]